MDHPDESLVTSTSHMAGSMNYPSTTQALFALIVMIIVLLFILVYCCWGTFSCAQPGGATPEDSLGRGGGGERGQRVLSGSHTAVILPINNMIFIRDAETQCIYPISINQDKPPAYTEVLTGAPPPPYTPDASPAPAPPTRTPEVRPSPPDLPPSYEFCLTTPPTDRCGGLESEFETGVPSGPVHSSSAPSTPTTTSADTPGEAAPDADTTQNPEWRGDAGLVLAPLDTATQEASGGDLENHGTGYKACDSLTSGGIGNMCHLQTSENSNQTSDLMASGSANITHDPQTSGDTSQTSDLHASGCIIDRCDLVTETSGDISNTSDLKTSGDINAPRDLESSSDLKTCDRLTSPATE